MDLSWSRSNFPPFVKFIQSLPNLHTLEIGAVSTFAPTPPRNALKGVKLPQIKTLILPPSSYPILQCCCDVEDIICVGGELSMSLDGFIESLASNPDSKVKRLAIPLIIGADPSRK